MTTLHTLTASLLALLTSGPVPAAPGKDAAREPCAEVRPALPPDAALHRLADEEHRRLVAWVLTL